MSNGFHTLISAQTTRALNRAVQYMEARYADPISVPALAAEAGLGINAFQYYFQHSYHKTPAEYLAGVRVARAAALLTESGISIKNIHSKVGYASASGLRRAFKREHGCTLVQYRNR